MRSQCALRTFALATLFLLAALCVSTAASAQSPQPGNDSFYLSGLIQTGGDPTDPKPAQSTYFRTQFGGFQVIPPFAGYVVMVEVVKKPAKTAYSRVLMDNPADPTAPFVHDGVLETTTETQTLSHGPVPKLQIGQQVRVDLILYDDEARTHEIDRLTQVLRSPVDTTGPEIRVLDRISGKPSPPSPSLADINELWRFDFDARKWRLGSQSAEERMALREYVLPGETVDGWSELVSSMIMATSGSPSELYEILRAQHAQDCPSLKIDILDQSSESLLYEWRHEGCHGFPPQHELKRIARRPNGLLTLAYVQKTPKLPDETRKTWLAILRNAGPAGEAGR